MEEYTKQIHRCFRCGYCKFTGDFSDFNCPAYARFRLETYSTGGRLWLIYAWLKNEIEWSEHLGGIIYSCTTCKNCVEQCPMGFASDIVDWVVSARSTMVERGRIPPLVKRFLETVYRYGNPLRMLRSDRDAWADGIRRYQRGDEYLLYVGCLGSYDESGQAMARSVACLLNEGGVSFGILGSEEECCGNESYNLGEEGLFQVLAQKNIQKFKELGVKKVVTLSPHAYNIMKNNYPALGGNFEVSHYTQLLGELVKKKKARFSQAKAKVAYHDPCFLGRYNKIYDVPREILQNIPGIELVEMTRNRENSFCCGGGSGNFAIDLLKGSQQSPSRVRVREAYETGAEVLVVACPACMTMFLDAVKAEGLEEELAVKDISEIMVQAMSH